jgi:hypothetical protein
LAPHAAATHHTIIVDTARELLKKQCVQPFSHPKAQAGMHCAQDICHLHAGLLLRKMLQGHQSVFAAARCLLLGSSTLLGADAARRSPAAPQVNRFHNLNLIHASKKHLLQTILLTEASRAAAAAALIADWPASLHS